MPESFEDFLFELSHLTRYFLHGVKKTGWPRSVIIGFSKRKMVFERIRKQANNSVDMEHLKAAAQELDKARLAENQTLTQYMDGFKKTN